MTEYVKISERVDSYSIKKIMCSMIVPFMALFLIVLWIVYKDPYKIVEIIVFTLLSLIVLAPYLLIPFGNIILLLIGDRFEMFLLNSVGIESDIFTQIWVWGVIFFYITINLFVMTSSFIVIYGLAKGIITEKDIEEIGKKWGKTAKKKLKIAEKMSLKKIRDIQREKLRNIILIILIVGCVISIIFSIVLTLKLI